MVVFLSCISLKCCKDVQLCYQQGLAVPFCHEIFSTIPTSTVGFSKLHYQKPLRVNRLRFFRNSLWLQKSNCNQNHLCSLEHLSQSQRIKILSLKNGSFCSCGVKPFIFTSFPMVIETLMMIGRYFCFVYLKLRQLVDLVSMLWN